MAQKMKSPRPVRLQVLKRKGALLLRKTKGVRVPSLKRYRKGEPEIRERKVP